MGLRATIHQRNSAALILLSGDIRNQNLSQIKAIFRHLHARGCCNFAVDITGLAPMSVAVRRHFNAIIGLSTRSQLPERTDRAVRRLADTPAARPQPGCGDTFFHAH